MLHCLCYLHSKHGPLLNYNQYISFLLVLLCTCQCFCNSLLLFRSAAVYVFIIKLDVILLSAGGHYNTSQKQFKLLFSSDKIYDLCYLL